MEYGDSIEMSHDLFSDDKQSVTNKTLRILVMDKQKIQWLPLHKLSLFAFLVDGILQDTKDMYPLLSQAKDKPYIMDDATIHRVLKLFTERLEMLPTHTEQITRWR